MIACPRQLDWLVPLCEGAIVVKLVAPAWLAVDGQFQFAMP